MTAENSLMGLVPLGYQLGDSADHARYVDSDTDVALGQPIVLTNPTKCEAAIGVPFCSARQESSIPLFPGAVELYTAGQ